MQGFFGVSQKRRTVQQSPPNSEPAPALLIADADPNVQLELCRWLQADGYSVFACDSGEETLAILHEHHPMMLIINSSLIDMSGVDLCGLIKGDDRLGFVPIILMDETGRACLDRECYADTRIVKPITPDELRY